MNPESGVSPSIQMDPSWQVEALMEVYFYGTPLKADAFRSFHRKTQMQLKIKQTMQDEKILGLWPLTHPADFS